MIREREAIIPRVRRAYDAVIGNDFEEGRTAHLYGHEVKFGSTRLRVFMEKGFDCVNCGIRGQFFAIEKSSKLDNRPHLNLYAVDEGGNEVLMTKDHIIPKSKGGSDRMNNLQPMCEPCNQEKGDDIRQ